MIRHNNNLVKSPRRFTGKERRNSRLYERHKHHSGSHRTDFMMSRIWTLEQSQRKTLILEQIMFRSSQTDVSSFMTNEIKINFRRENRWVLGRPGDSHLFNRRKHSHELKIKYVWSKWSNLRTSKVSFISRNWCLILHQ